MKKTASIITLALLTSALLAGGCGSGEKQSSANSKDTFVYGTTAYGVAMDNAGMNPHDSYKGWSTLRYGVGETLFRFNEQMQPEPWLASKYERLDDKTIKITLKDNIKFSSGRPLTGSAVKACLEDLLAKHDRAAADLQITSITADGQAITIQTKDKAPALINYLCDPYGCIIDMEAGTADDAKISGTGPYITESLTPTEIHLKKNPNYWNGAVATEKVIVKSITNGDTLTMAMQNGELDAAQGLPYASIKLFQGKDNFKLSSVATSRVFQGAFNFRTPALQDANIRQAIAIAIDKEGFVNNLLHKNGAIAQSPFPEFMPSGQNLKHVQSYNPTKAKELLAASGWSDTNGDGYVDKDGKNLELRWLTYTSRQELPLLAEAAQSFLKDIGIKLNVNATDNYNAFLKGGDWDIYAKAFVTAPTGDPQYYFTTHVLDSSAYNNGGYHSDKMEALALELRNELNPQRRALLGQQMADTILEDNAFLYASHLQMNLVMSSSVSGFTAHPSDYYEITASLKK